MLGRACTPLVESIVGAPPKRILILLLFGHVFLFGFIFSNVIFSSLFDLYWSFLFWWTEICFFFVICVELGSFRLDHVPLSWF